MRSSSNLDRYYLSIPSNARNILNEFGNSPHSNLIFKNKKGLIYHAELVDFDDNSWNFNPQKFCVDHYGSQFYYPIILVCNELKSIFQFNTKNIKGKIIAPQAQTIASVLTFEKPKV